MCFIKIKKLSIFCFSLLLLTVSCSSEEESISLNIEEELTSNHIVDDPSKRLLMEILLEASTDNEIVNEVNNSVIKSLEYGFDESLFVDELLDSDQDFLTQKKKLYNLMRVRSRSNSIGTSHEVFSINGLEIYWPYSEDWNGKDQPIITYCPLNENEYIDGDKLTAYRYTENSDETTRIDSLLIDEAYCMNNPVWIINKSSVSRDEIENLKKGELKYLPRNKNLIKIKQNVLKSAAAEKIAETKVISIQSTQQHDDWANGGSEYIIYWFFPAANFGLAEHKTGQIKFSRKEISKKTVRSIDFYANYDWDKGQSHNKLKIIEFDPGKEKSFDIKLGAVYKVNDNLTLNGEFKTTIKINNQDDHITEHVIARTAMFTTETKVSDVYYKRTFSGGGVNVVVSIRGVNGLEF